MNEIVQKVNELQMELCKLVAKVSTKDAVITEEQYQGERRKHILAHLRERISAKRIPLTLIAEWSDKSIDHCRDKVTYRGDRKKRNNLDQRWATDVVVFLCDLWEISVPSWCKEERLRQGIE